jgi:hypothetical protein
MRGNSGVEGESHFDDLCSEMGPLLVSQLLSQGTPVGQAGQQADSILIRCWLGWEKFRLTDEARAWVMAAAIQNDKAVGPMGIKEIDTSALLEVGPVSAVSSDSPARVTDGPTLRRRAAVIRRRRRIFGRVGVALLLAGMVLVLGLEEPGTPAAPPRIDAGGHVYGGG